MSTPIQQIRNIDNTQGNNMMSFGGGLPSMPTQAVNQNLQMPIYNPNPENIPNMQNPLQQPSMHNNSQLVDDILKEMSSSGTYNQEPEPDLNVGNINYAMDGVNIPQTQQNNNEILLSENTVPDSANNTNNSIINGVNTDDFFADLKLNESHDLSAVDKFLKQIKPIILVFLIVVILSLHQVNRVIFSFVPQLIIENGQLSIYGILFRGLLASILYFLGTYLLL
jgi:hypothetical protein